MDTLLGFGLTALAIGLAGLGWRKRQARRQIPAGAIRPEFAAIGAIMRPILLFLVAVLAVKITVFYVLFDGRRYLSPAVLTGIMFVLAGYATYVTLALRRIDPAPAVVEHKPQSTVGSAA
jgi:hypothetical protein